MIDALSLVGRSLRDLWEEFAFLMVLNVLWSLSVLLAIWPWFVLRLPWPLVLALSLLLAVPLPIISAGICFVANQVTRGIAVGWPAFGTGVRRHWRKSLVVALINLFMLFFIATNLRFYALVLKGSWTNWALGIWLVLAVYWLLTQIFWFPMILELESEKVLLGLRNALAMVIITPGFSLTLAAVMLLLGVVCTVLTVPAVLFLASLFLLIANHATRSRLAHVQKKPYHPGMQEDR